MGFTSVYTFVVSPISMVFLAQCLVKNSEPVCIIIGDTVLLEVVYKKRILWPTLALTNEISCKLFFIKLIKIQTKQATQCFPSRLLYWIMRFIQDYKKIISNKSFCRLQA